MIRVSCEDYVKIRKEELKSKLQSILKKTRVPKLLTIIQVGNNQASNSYIKGKIKDCEEIGIDYNLVHISDEDEIDIIQNNIENAIEESLYNCVDGIIVQLPLPEGIDLEYIQKLIPPDLDVDGFRKDSLYDPCTPKGIIDWMKYNGVELQGKVITVLGRSKIVGLPLVNMLIKEGATVISCNSHTSHPEIYTRQSNIVISAVGKRNMLSLYDINPDNLELIVDVGINRDENNKLCGDIDRETIQKYVDAYITPVPKGVGLLTRLALMENVVNSKGGPF